MLNKFLSPLARNIVYPLVEDFARASAPTNAGKANDILLVRTDHIGDFILFTPAFEPLKRVFPNARLVFLGSSVLEDIVARFSGIDEFIPVDFSRFRTDFRYRFSVLQGIRARRFRAVVNPMFFPSAHADAIVRVSDAREKIGVTGRNPRLYPWLLEIDSGIESELERNAALVRAIGGDMATTIPTFSVAPRERRYAEVLLQSRGISPGDPFVVIAPSAGWEGRRWGEENFAHVVTWLRGRGISAILVGAPRESDRSVVRRVIVAAGGGAVNLVGETPLAILAAILAESRCVLGNDSGVIHLAAAVRAPVVCIMGGGNFKRFFPYGNLRKNRIVYDERARREGCHGCNWTCACCLSETGVPRCIRDVSATQVVQEMNGLLFAHRA